MILIMGEIFYEFIFLFVNWWFFFKKNEWGGREIFLLFFFGEKIEFRGKIIVRRESFIRRGKWKNSLFFR